jgi:hypothetical protein
MAGRFHAASRIYALVVEAGGRGFDNLSLFFKRKG